MEPRLFLAKLPPLKSILSIVRSSKENGLFGTALSDPYLGCASPLISVSTLAELDQIIDDRKPGGLAFGLPMAHHPDMWAHREQLLADHDWNRKVALVCKIDDRISIEEALRRKETEWEMWEDIDPSDGEAATEAAVALNSWLWKHCGGWRNTFG